MLGVNTLWPEWTKGPGGSAEEEGGKAETEVGGDHGDVVHVAG